MYRLKHRNNKLKLIMDVNLFSTLRDSDCSGREDILCVGEQKEAGESPIMRGLIICFLRCSNEGEYYRQNQVQVAETVINKQV
jgi:hypothetical protein